MMALFVVLLAGTALMRLGEVGVSAARIRRRPEALVQEGWLFPLMALLHLGLIVAPLAEVWALGRPFRPEVGGPALAVFAAATLLRIWTLRTLGRSWNVRVVRPPDGGIVTMGPYRWIRHPNYLVVVLEIAALPMVHGAWLSAIGLSALNAFVLFHRIRTEERVLADDPAWRRAMAAKARLVPGVF